MLGAWWQAEGLPTVVVLNLAQCERVLAKIAALEWDGRPFTPPAT